MPPTPFLLTGTTGGLGAKILHDLLHIHHIPPHFIIATSRSATARAQFESQGLQFRVADYSRRSTLDEAFADVNNLLFISSSERDDAKRNAEHANVVEAAKRAGVGRVWYVSLAFGGFGDGSLIGFQQAHYRTEDELKRGVLPGLVIRLYGYSGLEFISLRAGTYSDAFPLVLNWYPSTKTVLMPNIQPPVTDSKVAFASRDELGEAMATLLAKGLQTFPSIKPQMDKNIILLTGSKAESLVGIVGAIKRGRGISVGMKYLEPQEWIEACAEDDEGGKGRAWFEARLTFVQGLCDGDGELVDPALETLLGRRPETGTESVERLVREDDGYTWHQNHAR